MKTPTTAQKDFPRLVTALHSARAKISTKTCTIVIALCLITPLAQAYLTIGESADVTPQGTLKIGIEPQIRLSEGSGANMSVFLDGGIREDLSWRALLGAGETDLVLNGSLKWVPYPDFEKQPAIGFRGDISVGREAEETFTVVRIAPMVSKQVQSDYVLFTPYVALPVGMQGYRGKSETLAQLALGSDIHMNEYENAHFNIELGTNLNRAFSYLSFNFVYMLGTNDGFRVKTRSQE